MLSFFDPAVPLTDIAAHVKKRWRQHQRVELALSLGLCRLDRGADFFGTTSTGAPGAATSPAAPR